jgi:hypothetical protein
MGPVVSRLRELFDLAVRGNLPAYRHWNIPVFTGVPVSLHR